MTKTFHGRTLKWWQWAILWLLLPQHEFSLLKRGISISYEREVNLGLIHMVLYRIDVAD